MKIIKLFIPILLFVIIVSFSIDNNKAKYKLLVYATVHDSLKIDRNDTNWLNKEFCIDIKIDTIDLNNVNQLKGGSFSYRGNIYYNSQLFDIDSYGYLKSLFVSFIDLECTTVAFEPNLLSSPGNCFSEYIKERLKIYHETAKKIGKTLKIYIGVHAMDVKTKKNIDLNYILLFINPK